MTEEIEVKKAGRPPKRKEIGSNTMGSRLSYKDRNKLTVQGRDENFVYRWVNSDDYKNAGRIEKFLQMGYTFVNEEDVTAAEQEDAKASNLGSHLGRPVGHGTRAVLMKIPKEFYEEDQAEKQAEVDATEKGMVDKELIANADGLYGEGLTVAKNNKPRMKLSVEN